MVRIFRRRKREISLREIRASLNSLCVNLLRYSEMRRFRLASEEDLRFRLEMSLSDLKDIRALTENLGEENPLSKELSQPLEVIRAYAIVSEAEGWPFIEENYERILRSARWCLSEVDKVYPQGRKGETRSFKG
ncbi:MAG: hypothetical protein ACETVR_03195 [Candidatus Bathyarchaeia archaeon]